MSHQHLLIVCVVLTHNFTECILYTLRWTYMCMCACATICIVLSEVVSMSCWARENEMVNGEYWREAHSGEIFAHNSSCKNPSPYLNIVLVLAFCLVVFCVIFFPFFTASSYFFLYVILETNKQNIADDTMPITWSFFFLFL